MIKVNISIQTKPGHGTFNLKVHTTFHTGVITRILGPSGVGKTTLLKVIAGLIRPDRGKITVQDVCWYDSETNYSKKVQERHIGFVFQDYALFPNMTVEEHLLFGTKDRAYIAHLLRLAEMEGLVKRYPRQLSGGQQQRLAILRALSTKPALLLMDEPFSALDAALKKRFIANLKNLFSEQGTTVILVTHIESEVDGEEVQTFEMRGAE